MTRTSEPIDTTDLFTPDSDRREKEASASPRRPPFAFVGS